MLKGVVNLSGKLTCSAMNCVHNMNGLCSANAIEVDGISAHSSSGTMCGTFVEKGLKNSFVNMTNMNVAGEIKQIFTNSKVVMSPKIKCYADHCKYNEQHLCNASNVIINGPDASTSEGTKCETFIE